MGDWNSVIIERTPQTAHSSRCRIEKAVTRGTPGAGLPDGAAVHAAREARGPAVARGADGAVGAGPVARRGACLAPAQRGGRVARAVAAADADGRGLRRWCSAVRCEEGFLEMTNIIKIIFGLKTNGKQV